MIIPISYWHFPGKSDFQVFQNFFSFQSPCSPLSGRHHAAKLLPLTQKGEAGGGC